MNSKALFFGVVTVVAWLATLWLAFDAFQFQNQSITTTGTVVEIDVERSTRRSNTGVRRETISYFPIVSYRTEAGEMMEVRSSTSVSSDVDVGDTIQVRYNRAAPTEMRLDSFGGVWGLPAGIGFGALVLFFFTLVFILRR